MPAVSADIRNTIAQRIKSGDAIALIAQDLGLSRATVYKYAPEIEDWLRWTQSKSKSISRLAYEKLERAMSSGDARLALDWLKVTDLSARPGDSLHIHGDVSLVQATSYVPATSTTSTTSQSSLAVSTGTEAPAKPGQPEISLSLHENFSQFSDAQLEAELERRRAARNVIDAEVVR